MHMSRTWFQCRLQRHHALVSIVCTTSSLCPGCHTMLASPTVASRVCGVSYSLESWSGRSGDGGSFLQRMLTIVGGFRGP